MVIDIPLLPVCAMNFCDYGIPRHSVHRHVSVELAMLFCCCRLGCWSGLHHCWPRCRCGGVSGSVTISIASTPVTFQHLYIRYVTYVEIAVLYLVKAVDSCQLHWQCVQNLSYQCHTLAPVFVHFQVFLVSVISAVTDMSTL